MPDYNLHNRAEFDTKSLQLKIAANPYAEISYPLPLEKSWVYWLQKITWIAIFPIRNFRIVGKEILSPLQSEYFIQCPTPRPFFEGTTINFLNPNQGRPNEIIVTIDGTIVKPRSEAFPISLKEMLGYILSGNKGQLLLDEAVMDQLDILFQEQGIFNFRETAPLLEAIKQLPEVLQGPIAMRAFQDSSVFNQSKMPLALTDKERDREISALIGDASLNSLIPLPQLRELAEKLIDLGWKKSMNLSSIP